MDHKTDTDIERAAFSEWMTSEVLKSINQPVSDGMHTALIQAAEQLWDSGKEMVVRGWKARASIAASAGSEPSEVSKRRAKYLLNDTDAARSYVGRFFQSIGRHDFDDYIQHELAGDFACVLASALSAHPSPPEGALWRPLIEAPVDEIVLVAAEFDGPGDWRIKCGYLDKQTTSWRVFGASWEPTHWMRMPAPPASEAKERGNG